MASSATQIPGARAGELTCPGRRRLSARSGGLQRALGARHSEGVWPDPKRQPWETPRLRTPPSGREGARSQNFVSFASVFFFHMQAHGRDCMYGCQSATNARLC